MGREEDQVVAASSTGAHAGGARAAPAPRAARSQASRALT